MLIDTNVIAYQGAPGGLQVLAQRHEVMWRDGTAAVLHPVYAHGHPMFTLRAVALPGQVLQLVDLERLLPRLGGDLRQSAERDHPGLVFYTLRGAYGSAQAFTEAATRVAKGCWHPTPAGPLWAAAARAVDSDTLASAEAATTAATRRAMLRRPTSLWCPQ